MGIHAPETGISIDINGYHISYQYQYKLSITNFKLSIINYQYRYHYQYQYQYQLSISIININIKLCFHTFLYFHTTITPTGKHSKLSCVKFETITRAKFHHHVVSPSPVEAANIRERNKLFSPANSGYFDCFWEPIGGRILKQIPDTF